MSTSGIKSIIKRINKSSDKINILTCPTHERYESNLCLTGHNFYSIITDKYHIKKWNNKFAPKPDNYTLITENDIDKLDIDLVLIQQKFGQYQLLKPIAEHLQIPSIVLEHTLPDLAWPNDYIMSFKQMSGELNLFISEYSKNKWGWNKQDKAYVLEHGIDTEQFKIKQNHNTRYNAGLSVVNDWVNRDKPCGFNFWLEATKGLPTYIVGDTPGLSKPSQNIDELINIYNQHKIFINSSLVSPIPTSLMEAMACGCAVISTNTCMIPEVVKDSSNGILVNTPQEMRNAFIYLLNNPKICEKLGSNARQTIEKKYNINQFISKWKKTLEYAKELRFGS